MTNNGGYPPHTLSHKDIPVLSGIYDNFLQCVYDSVVIVFEGDCHSSPRETLLKGAGLPLHTANRFLYIIIGRYKYHKNTIINNGVLSLVGIADAFAARACPSHCRNNVTSEIQACRVFTHAHPYFVFHDCDSNVLCVLRSK